MVFDNLLTKHVTPYEVQQRLAQRVKHTRRSLKHSRRKASIQTGVPEATIRHFEDTGEISLRQFLVLWSFYCGLSELDQETQKSLRSLEDVGPNTTV